MGTLGALFTGRLVLWMEEKPNRWVVALVPPGGLRGAVGTFVGYCETSPPELPEKDAEEQAIQKARLNPGWRILGRVLAYFTGGPKSRPGHLNGQPEK
jgi:hypothetical protein